MSLFPNSDIGVFSENDRGIQKRMSDFYTQSISINQTYWVEADLDTRFEVGDQNVWREVYGVKNKFNQKQFNFNRIRRIINLISGYQRKNRKSTIATPVENADMQTADQHTKIMMISNKL